MMCSYDSSMALSFPSLLLAHVTWPQSSFIFLKDVRYTLMILSLTGSSGLKTLPPERHMANSPISIQFVLRDDFLYIPNWITIFKYSKAACILWHCPISLNLLCFVNPYQILPDHMHTYLYCLLLIVYLLSFECELCMAESHSTFTY